VAARFTWPRIAERTIETYAGFLDAAGEEATV
jgi:hypothetical protein